MHSAKPEGSVRQEGFLTPDCSPGLGQLGSCYRPPGGQLVLRGLLDACYQMDCEQGKQQATRCLPFWVMLMRHALIREFLKAPCLHTLCLAAAVSVAFLDKPADSERERFLPRRAVGWAAVVENRARFLCVRTGRLAKISLVKTVL